MCRLEVDINIAQEQMPKLPTPNDATSNRDR